MRKTIARYVRRLADWIDSPPASVGVNVTIQPIITISCDASHAKEIADRMRDEIMRMQSPPGMEC